MPTSVAQRLGPFTRLVHYLEGTRGSDSGITAGNVLPLRDASGFQVQRDEVDAPFYNNTLGPWSTAPGPVLAAGPVPTGLEFLTSGKIFKMPVGTTGYSRVAKVTGSVHNFYLPSGPFSPLTAQLQAEYGESTAQYIRAKYAMLKSLAFAYANGGAAPLDLNFVGSGDVAETDLAGTKTDNGYSGVSVYNGQSRLAVSALAPSWFTLGSIQEFSAMLDTGATAEPVAFNDGVAGSVNPTNYRLTGNLGLMMARDGANPDNNLNFQAYAKNRTLMMHDWCYANAPVAALPYPSSWLYCMTPSIRFARRDPRPGGKAGLRITQPWWMVPDTTFSKVGGSDFGTVVGPYNMTGTNNIFSYKINGGGTLTVTLGTSATKTVDAIVTELNANGGFSAIAYAENFNGRLRYWSKQVSTQGAASSVQFDTATANHCGTLLGFNNTVFSGFDSPFWFQLYNLQNSDY